MLFVMPNHERVLDLAQPKLGVGSVARDAVRCNSTAIQHT
jgi:hypothetical protein